MRLIRIKSLEPIKNKWLDKDEIMLHACFQLLENYIEEEKGDTHCDYEAHKEFVDELRCLYKWWLNRKEIKDCDWDKQEIEDDEMLIRLMKIRRALWT